MYTQLIAKALTDIDWQAAVIILLGSTVAWIVVSTWLQYRRLAHIKGPWLASFTPFWLFYHACKGDIYAACEKNHKIYGSPLRVAPNIVTTNDPQSFRTVTAPKSVWTRGHWFDGVKFDPRAENILSMRDEKQHSEMRRKLIPGYSGHDVPSLESDIDDRVVELKDLIAREFVAKQQSFDLARVAHYFTLDILTQIAFGQALGFLTKNEDLYHFIRNSEQFFPVMEIASNHPTILGIMRSPLLAAFQPKDTDKTGLGAILGHARKIVNDRLDGTDSPQDMLGSFIKQGLSRTELQSETVLLLLGGADSTATALRHTLLHTISNPLVYRKLLKEIDETVAAGKASMPVITTTESQNLPYLRAVIMEGLRIFMPLVGLATRQAPKGGAFLNETFLPEGTQVGMAPYSMLRRTDLFGDDADTFRPERWIDGDEETIKAMEKSHSFVFGGGRTSCLGKNIAMMELRKAVFELFRYYDLVLVNPVKPISIRANGVIAENNLLIINTELQLTELQSSSIHDALNAMRVSLKDQASTMNVSTWSSHWEQLGSSA